MSAARLWVVTVVGAAALLAAGCQPALLPPEKPRTVEVPLYLVDTIGQRAVVSGGDYVDVYGVGLVTGLNGTGAGVYPRGLKEQMIKQIMRRRRPNPESILADKNNAVVIVAGKIPPGSRVGEMFDLQIMAHPGTETTSLEGGTLLEADLARVGETRTGTGLGAPLATGEGALFVSPFVAEDRPLAANPRAGGETRLRPIAPGPPTATPPAARHVDPRIAVVLGGGRCLYDRGFFLNLLDPSERLAETMIAHVNARFPDAAKGRAQPGVITLKVPARYQDDKQRFLNIVGALYLVDAPVARERRLRELVAELQAGRDAERVCLALESFGQSAAALLEPLLASRDDSVRFRAAETLAWLNRPIVVPVLSQFARDDASPYQAAAVRALGRLDGNAGAAPIRDALNAKEPAVRMAAYLTLVKTAPQLLDSERVVVPEKLELAKVPTRSAPFVYVGRQLEPRVVIFGDVKLRPPLLVETPRLLASLSEGGQRITLVNRRYGPQCRVECGLDLMGIVARMAGPLQVDAQHPQPRALGLAYADVVGFLDQAQANGSLAARIVFEPTEFGTMPTAQPFTPGGKETDIVVPQK